MVRHAKQLSASAFLLTLAVSGAARAQSFNDYLNKKYQIQQQQADSDRARAEAERLGAEAEATSSASQASPTSTFANSYGTSRDVIAHGSNDFAGKRVPQYRLQNGVTLQATGGFHPYDGVRCTTDCFVPLQPHQP